MDKLQNLLQRAKTTMSEEDYQDLKLLADSYVCLTNLVEDKNMSIHRLRKLLFGPATEKTKEVLKADSKTSSKENSSDQDDAPSAPEPKAKPPPKGHGRNGAKAYTKAVTIRVPHDSLKSGDFCPDCREGVVYEQAAPGVLVRIVGQAPLQAKVYELQKLRCNLCGKIFTAQPPKGIGSKKYDATAASMIALLKYGSGCVQGEAVCEMRVGPSWPGDRTRLQTSPNCGGQEPSW